MESKLLENDSVVVAHMGAREHYALARMLQHEAVLSKFLTDAYVTGSTTRTILTELCIGSWGSRLASRHSTELPPEKVHPNWRFFVQGAWEMKRAKSRTSLFEAFVSIGKSFASWSGTMAENSSAFVGYSCASLEALEAQKQRGAIAVLNQIAPGPMEERIVQEERRRWPGLETIQDEIPECYWDRLSAEWSVADIVVVNSAWSKKGLLETGVQEEKIKIVPLAYEAGARNNLSLNGNIKQRPLKVVWLGTLCLRKGFMYAIEAARLLERNAVNFEFHGPCAMELSSIHLPSNVSIHPAVPRSGISRIYEGADLFLLPTLSDGFAITQLEAMSHGIPVIATDRCGLVVKHGENGFKVDTMDARGIADAINSILDGEKDLEELKHSALTTAKNFSLQAVAREWRHVLEASF